MEQVDFPDGVKSRHIVGCTEKQAREKIGTLYPDNTAWRVIDMISWDTKNGIPA